MKGLLSNSRLIALLLAFITLIVFLPAGWYQFLNYDDNEYVTDNPFVKNGLNWTDLKWAFTAFHSGNWQPLTWISHQTDCELFGLNAGAHHIVNILFHAANVALVFMLLLRLTEKLWPSAMVAALFAWHPLHVESVAWIAERKDVLSTFCAAGAPVGHREVCQRKLPAQFLVRPGFLCARPARQTDARHIAICSAAVGCVAVGPAEGGAFHQ